MLMIVLVTRFTSSPSLRYFTGGRVDNCINVWDTRNPGQILARLHRPCTTNQRLQFEITRYVSRFRSSFECIWCYRDGSYIVSGTSDRSVHVWDVKTTIETTGENDRSEPIPPTATHQGRELTFVSQILSSLAVAACAVGAVSVHPTRTLIACGSGQRTFPHPDKDVDEEASDLTVSYVYQKLTYDNCVRLFDLE